jgi:hypothetical protein
VLKTTLALEAAGVWASLWTASGMPAAGAAQGSVNGANCDKSTTGAIPFSNPGSGALSLLQAVAISMPAPGALMLYDRIWHNSTLVGNSASAQTFTQPSLPARVTDSGLGCRLGLEVYSSWGTSVYTCTITYRDSNDSSDVTTTVGTVVPGGSGAPAAGTFVELPMANALGCKYAKQVQWGTSTGTAGNFGLVLYRPLAIIAVPAIGVANVVDFAALGMPGILNDACLALCWTANATTAGLVTANLTIGAG